MTHANLDPSDALSIPLETRKLRLATVYSLPIRNDPAKPGRKLLVTYDARHPMIPDFVVKYSYVVSFEDQKSAGNHFHNVKHEIFFPLAGVFKLYLEDTETKAREVIDFSSDDSVAVYVGPKTAHRVLSLTSGGILLVHATAPNTESDEFPYSL